MDGVFVGGRIRGAANVHLELGDVVGPILGRNFRIRLNAVLVGFVDGIGMVLAGLDGLVLGGGQMGDNFRD